MSVIHFRASFSCFATFYNYGVPSGWSWLCYILWVFSAIRVSWPCVDTFCGCRNLGDPIFFGYIFWLVAFRAMDFRASFSCFATFYEFWTLRQIDGPVASMALLSLQRSWFYLGDFSESLFFRRFTSLLSICLLWAVNFFLTNFVPFLTRNWETFGNFVSWCKFN